MNLLNSLKNIFTREKVFDKFFGELEFSQDKDSKIYYLERDIDFGPYKNITLTLESKSKEASKDQADLLNIIQDNFSKVWANSKDLYEKEYQKYLYDEYEVESICILNSDKNFEWELWLVKKGRFENCIIDFDKLDAKHISFSA